MDAWASSFFLSPPPPAGAKYDVFISFRGIDTRNNITSHLYAALCREKIVTFIDSRLRRGDELSEALVRTIEVSKVSIVVFSKNYTSSRWCLDELVTILESKRRYGQIVIPVFFKVNPSHVRKQIGTFAQGLAYYQGHQNIQKWKDALTEAANLSGWDSSVIRPEATLVEEIVRDILEKLYYTSSSDFDGLVGIRSRLQKVESSLITCSGDVLVIGIWGMGGIGKTTLAKSFFNHNFAGFEGHCFLPNVREESQKRGLNHLRKKLVSELLKDANNVDVGAPHLGLNSFIRNRLCQKKVLVVLDDVNDSQHLEFLAGGRDWFGRGSIIIVTSRDKQVLKNGVDMIYRVQELGHHEALHLFSQYAFKQKQHHMNDHDHKGLCEKVIKYASGNPLALKILGSFLFDKSKEEQKSALRKLERTPNRDIQKVLQLSYDGLDYEEQNIFLDLACFFNGSFVKEVKSILNGCGFSTEIGIRVLVDKSLVVLRDGRLEMHDLLQEMGREIVRRESTEEPGKRSRLWDYRDISRVLTRNAVRISNSLISHFNKVWEEGS